MAPPPRQVLPRGTAVAAGCLILGGGVCPSVQPPPSSSPAPVGAGALPACWWWEMRVPPTGSWVSPFPRRRGGPWVTRCLAVLGTCWGGSCPPPLSHPPSTCVPPSPKRFSGPFPLCVPPSGEGGGGSAAAAFHCLWGGLDPPQPGSACWGGAGSPQPLSAGATGQVNPLPPPEKWGSLIGLGA